MPRNKDGFRTSSIIWFSSAEEERQEEGRRSTGSNQQ
jgi:hypothetical protein